MSAGWSGWVVGWVMGWVCACVAITWINRHG